jgi:soluble lytic murein transglycosylase
MPVVPSLDPSQAVTPTVNPDTQSTTAVTAGLLNQGTQQLSQAGDALGQAANAQSQMAIDAQNLANQTRVNDALNQLKTQQQDLMYNPQTGVTSQTGVKALQRDSGMSLADEYTGKLNDTASTLASSLANPMQQRMFQQQANDITTQFHGATTQWEGQQFKQYALSTQNGTIKLATDQVGLAFNNPTQIDNGLQSIKAAVYQAGQINGLAATEIEANQRTMTSNALTGAIDTALQQGQTTYANGLLKKYSDQMTADDILKVNGKMNSFLGTQAAANTVSRVMSTVGPALSNSPIDRMVAITAQSESGNKDTNADGSIVTSSAGARYKMQVTPATAAQPGYGIQPAQSDTPAEWNRVGVQKLQAMVQKYGDPAKAWAAYNGGEGTVDAAVAKANAAGTPGAWLANMPQETQAYVQKNVAQYQSGTAVAARPSKLDVINQVRADPILQQKPEWMAQAVTLAGQQYDEQTAAIAQKDTANVAQVYRTLSQNRGNIQSVNPADLAALNPADLKDVMSYAKTMAEGTNTTNTALYQTLITNPKMMSSMTPDQWQTQAPNFSVDDFKHLSQIRADLINNTGTNAPGSVNLRAMNETLTQRLQTMGINPYPKSVGFNSDPEAVSQVGAIRQFVTQSLLDAQKEAGKKFTEVDIENHIDGLFAKSVTFRNKLDFGVFSVNRPDTTQNMMSMTPDQIPDDVRAKLTADFKANGVAKPSPGQLLGAYWHFKTTQQKMSAN